MPPVIRFNGRKLDPATIKALVSGTLVNGSKPSVWWNRQSVDFRNSFMDVMRTSAKNGESLTQAITRVVGGTVDGVSVPGIMKTTRARAGALAATAQNAVANEAALKTFQANNDVIKAVVQLSTLDNRTSDICIAYSGQAWDVNTLQPLPGTRLPFNGGPPRHFNCRSRLRPITKSFQELGVDADEIPVGTRASMNGQVPADISFSQFMKNKGIKFQDDLLGKKRAQLWRNDDITLTQLVDMRGNPLTLTQLEEIVGIKQKPTFNPATNKTTPQPKLTPPQAEKIGGITQAEADAHAAELFEAQAFKKNAQFNDSVVNFLTSGGNTEKLILEWIEKQLAQGIPKSVIDSAVKRVQTVFAKKAKDAVKIMDDLSKKHPDGILAFEDAAGELVVSFETADPLLAKALRERAIKIMLEPARQDVALLIRIEKRIDLGIPEDAVRKIILNSDATDAAKAKATTILDDAVKAAKQEAKIAFKQIEDIDFDSIEEFAAWVKGIRPGMSNSFADKEFMKLVHVGDSRVAIKVALKKARQQVELGDLGKAETLLKNLSPDQITKEITDELAKIAKRRVEMKATAQKVMDDLTNNGSITPAQIDDVVTAASDMAKPTMKLMIQDIGSQMAEVAQGKINKLINDFPFKVFEDLKKKGFTTNQMALLDDTFLEELALMKNGIFDDVVSLGMRKKVQASIDEIDVAVKLIKSLNKSSKGVDQMTAVINSLPDKLRISNILQSQIKLPMKQAAKKAKEARNALKKQMIQEGAIEGKDVFNFETLINDALKDVHKKLGKKQAQEKINEIKTKIASQKKNEVSIAEFNSDPTHYDDQVRALLSSDSMKKLDDAVKLFINDGAGSEQAKKKLFNLLYLKSDKQIRAIKEYVHRRVNPKTLSNGANFDAKVAQIVTKHANNVDAKVIRAELDALLKGENVHVKMNFEQTVMTRAGVKNIEELGVLAEGDAPASVLKIRAELKKHDPGNVPIPEHSLDDQLKAAKEWLNASSLSDDEFRRQQLQNSKSMVASGKRKISEGDNHFGENSWGITTKEWQKWVDNVAPTLTEWDISLLNQYTGGMAGRINAGLYDGGLSFDWTAGARAMNAALDKMPKHTGTVYRGTSPRANWTADYIDARYQVGKTVIERGFGSSSTQNSSAFSGELRFIIKTNGKSGAIMGQIGQYGVAEMEVLFKAGTKFRVIKKTRSGGSIKVWMEEI